MREPSRRVPRRLCRCETAKRRGLILTLVSDRRADFDAFELEPPATFGTRRAVSGEAAWLTDETQLPAETTTRSFALPSAAVTW